MIDTLVFYLTAPPTDWIRMLLVFLHLLCCVFALALILSADWQIFKGDMSPDMLKRIAHRASALLGLLWCTGIMLIFHDTRFDVSLIAQLNKLQLKLVVVTALTINGLLLHAVSFPLAIKQRKLTLLEALVLSVSGSVSTSHWLLAAFVGIARPLAQWPLSTLMSAYALFTAGVVVAGIVLSPLVRKQLNANQRVPNQMPEHGTRTPARETVTVHDPAILSRRLPNARRSVGIARDELTARAG